MKKVIYLLIIIQISLVSSTLKAQQDPNFTLYNFNLNIINPAAAGIQDDTELNLIYRNQWIGIPDAPRTASLVYSRGIGDKLGVAFTLMSDRIFILNETDIAIDFSYPIQFSEETYLYFGMKFGGGFTNIDLSRAYNMGNDPLFTQNQSFFNPHIGAGFLLENKKYYISLSVPNFLNGNRYEKVGNAPRAAINNAHIYIGGAYNFELNNDIIISPRFMLRDVEGAPASYDIGASLDYQEKYTFGMNYRISEMYSIYSLIQFIPNLKFGISYDITTADSGLINDDGSIEFMVKYQFK